MTTTLTVDVLGTPIPQGSTRAFINPSTGRPIVTAANKKTKGWRQDVTAATHNAIAAARWTTITGPVSVRVTFYMPRPGYHYRSGKHAHELKPSAPTYCDKKPDVDKLLRAILDALGDANAFRDDAQVVEIAGQQRYANGPTGARIEVFPVALTSSVTPPQEALL